MKTKKEDDEKKTAEVGSGLKDFNDILMFEAHWRMGSISICAHPNLLPLQHLPRLCLPFPYPDPVHTPALVLGARTCQLDQGGEDAAGHSSKYRCCWRFQSV